MGEDRLKRKEEISGKLHILSIDESYKLTGRLHFVSSSSNTMQPKQNRTMPYNSMHPNNIPYDVSVTFFHNCSIGFFDNERKITQCALLVQWMFPLAHGLQRWPLWLELCFSESNALWFIFMTTNHVIPLHFFLYNLFILQWCWPPRWSASLEQLINANYRWIIWPDWAELGRAGWTWLDSAIL